MNLNKESKSFCTSCNGFVLTSAFSKLKNGNTRKTCDKHNKRAKVVNYDEWVQFESQLMNWKSKVSFYLNL